MNVSRPAPAEFEIPPFQPAAWLANGHLQTLNSALARVRSATVADQHRVQLEDGDQLVLHDNRPDAWRRGDPIALLVHGLCGSHASAYLVRTAAKLGQRGVRTFRLDQRGFGAGLHLAQKFSHAGRSEDIAAVVRWLADTFPGSSLTLLGFSLGGNVLLKYLGERAAPIPAAVERAAVVAPPIDLLDCAYHMTSRWNAPYSRYFVRLLLAYMRQRRELQPDLVPPLPARPPRSLHDFDDRFTAPLNGFRDFRDYYLQSSAKPLLPQIEVPTLILAAADDPIVPARIFRDIEPTSALRIHVAEGGGHVGFVARRNGDPDRYWSDWRILEWTLAGGARAKLGRPR